MPARSEILVRPRWLALLCLMTALAGYAASETDEKTPGALLHSDLVQVWDSEPYVYAPPERQDRPHVFDVGRDGDVFTAMPYFGASRFLVVSRDGGRTWQPKTPATPPEGDLWKDGAAVAYMPHAGDLYSLLRGQRSGAGGFSYEWKGVVKLSPPDATRTFPIWQGTSVYVQGQAFAPLSVEGSEVTAFWVEYGHGSALPGEEVGSFVLKKSDLVTTPNDPSQKARIVWPHCVPSAPFLPTQQGTWEALGECEPDVVGPSPAVCRFRVDPSIGPEPRVLCVEQATWPFPRQGATFHLQQYVTAAGLVRLYDTDEGQVAVRITDEGQVERIGIGPGQVPESPKKWVHQPFGSLIPLEQGSGGTRFVGIASDGRVWEVPLQTNVCVEESDACASDLVWVVPLGGDDYMTFFEVVRAVEDDPYQDHTTIFALRQHAPLRAVESSVPPVSPVPACPEARPVSPLVQTCARLALCHASAADQSVVIQRCTDYWSRPSFSPGQPALPPTAFEAFLATPDRCDAFMETFPLGVLAAQNACQPNGAVQCHGQYLVTCGLMPSDMASGSMRLGHCPSTTGSSPTCDEQGRLIDGTSSVACSELGAVCDQTTAPEPFCRPSACDGSGAPGCEGDTYVVCLSNGAAERRDCSRLGLSCVTDARGHPSCGPNDCPRMEDCVGDLLVVPINEDAMYLDCKAIGARTCSLAQGRAACVR